MNPLLSQLLPWALGASAIAVILGVFRLRGYLMGRRRQRLVVARKRVESAKEAKKVTAERLVQAEKELVDATEKEQADLEEIDQSARSGDPLDRIRDSLGRFRRGKDG